MALYAKAVEGKSFKPAPEGTTQAVIVAIEDLGLLPNQFRGGELQQKIRVVFQLAETRDDGHRFMVSKRYTLSLHEKATLRKDIESLLGRKLKPADLKGEGFDVETLVGKNCLISITHSPSKQDPTKTFANISTITPLLKGMTPMEPTPPVIPSKTTPVSVDDVPF